MRAGRCSQGFVVRHAALSRRDVLRRAPAAAAGLAMAGCGYSLAGRGSFLPAYIQSLGVPMFGNRTPYSPLEQIFTEKVRVEFQGRGRYQVLPAETGVDGIVRGEIMNIGAAPAGFNPNQQASRYRFTVVVSVSFTDARQQKVLVGESGAVVQRRVRAGERGQRESRGLWRRRRLHRSGARGRRSPQHRLRPLGRERHPRSVLSH